MREGRWYDLSITSSSYLLILLLRIIESIPPPQREIFHRSYYAVQPPYCTRTPIVTSSPSLSAPTAISREIQYMHFDIGLHSTVCFRLDDDNEHSGSNTSIHSSWLHTLRLDKLEHHHPVTQQYVFAIPEVKETCICECSPSSSTCNAQNYRFIECPQGEITDQDTSCYRTYFPDQSPNGCSSGSNPSLCCELKFRPWKNESYTAVMIEQPSTYATFVYTAYDYVSGRWVEMDKSVIRTQLDGGSQDKILDAVGRLELSVSAGGRASHQLERGMYFAPSNRGGEMEGITRMPINEVSERNYQRLGWYREGKHGRFVAENGAVHLDDVHKAKSLNCKDQTYMSQLEANYYMPGSFNLSKPLERLHPWIERARFYDGRARSVVVTHAEGTNLKIALRVMGGKDHRVLFFHNSSSVDDFSGSIIVDARSNRYFNVTLHNASGKINGIVKSSIEESSVDLHSFTTYVNDLEAVNRTLIIPLPSVVEEGPRMICMKADETGDERKICHVVIYHERPLEVDMDSNTWREGTGHCPQCNKINLDNVIDYLNPMRWVKGVSDIGELVMVLGNVVIYTVALFLLYQIITKVIIPVFKLCNWCLNSLPGVQENKSIDKKERRGGGEGKVEKKITHVHINTLHLGDSSRGRGLDRSTQSNDCGCSDCSSSIGDSPRFISPPPIYGHRENGVHV